MADILKNRFMDQPPANDDKLQRYEQVRRWGYELARYIADNTPTSREQALALTKTEEAVMWAHAAIARNE